MSRKQSNVSFAVATKALGDATAEDAFVRGAGSNVRTSRRQDVAKRRMTVYLPEDVALRLERLGVDERKSVSALIEEAVRTLLKR